MFKYSAVFRWRYESARLAHTQINKKKVPPLILWKPRHMTRGHRETWSGGHQSRSNHYIVFYPNLRVKELTEDEDSVHSTTSVITSQFLERHEVLHPNPVCLKGSTALAHIDEATQSPTWYLKFQQQRWLLFSYTFHILMAQLQYTGIGLAKEDGLAKILKREDDSCILSEPGKWWPNLHWRENDLSSFKTFQLGFPTSIRELAVKPSFVSL